MALKNVKVTISRLGVHTMEGNTTVYMPLANIEYMELGEKKDRPFGWQDGVRQEVFQRLDSGFFLFRRCHS